MLGCVGEDCLSPGSIYLIAVGTGLKESPSGHFSAWQVWVERYDVTSILNICIIHSNSPYVHLYFLFKQPSFYFDSDVFGCPSPITKSITTVLLTSCAERNYFQMNFYVRIFLCICLVAGASCREGLSYDTIQWRDPQPPGSRQWLSASLSLCESLSERQRKLPNAAAIFVNSKSRRLALGQWKTWKWKRKKKKERELGMSHEEMSTWGNEHAFPHVHPPRTPPKKKQEKEDGGRNNYEKNETKVVGKGGERVDTGKGAVEIQSFQQEFTKFHMRAENFPTQILLRFQVGQADSPH